MLKNHPDVRLAILFGSLASGRQTTESDLDLAVDAGRPLDLSLKMSLISELADRIGRPVDLVDLRSAGEPLLGQVLRYGKKILGDNTHYAAFEPLFIAYAILNAKIEIPAIFDINGF